MAELGGLRGHDCRDPQPRWLWIVVTTALLAAACGDDTGQGASGAGGEAAGGEAAGGQAAGGESAGGQAEGGQGGAPSPACGDGVPQAGEECDDGNAVDDDGCTNACTLPACGDAIVQDGEACDDGVNDGSYDGCEADCLALGPYCGDAAVDASEACDDGVNDGSYGGCAADCLALGPYCGDSLVDPSETCDDGVNDGSYDGCEADCLAFGPYCGDGLLDAGEVCDDGVNDGSYGGCAAGCQALGPYCGDGALTAPEACDDANADATDGCLASCVVPTSCLAIHVYDAQLPSGDYQVLPAGASAAAPFAVHCDMVTNGGGYTFLKIAPGAQYNAAQAEALCDTYGMQLWIPRSVEHKDAGWAIANDASIGSGATPDYMRILGIYPDFNGATCANQPMSSSNANCQWGASDGGPWFVHAVNNISEPNGDNSTTGSMYYQWDASGQIQWHNDISGAGYTSAFFMCDVGDKLP